MTYQPINNEVNNNLNYKYIIAFTLFMISSFFTGYFVCNNINNINNIEMNNTIT